MIGESMKPYSLGDVQRSVAWLAGRPYLEVCAFHPRYRPGKAFWDWNALHGTFPVVRYASDVVQVERLVREYAGSRLLVYSLNPRSEVLTNQRGFPRSAREHEVGVSQSLVLDFDVVGRASTERVQALGSFLGRVDEFFLDHGFARPVRAFTGGGYHVLAAYPTIRVAEHSDVRARLRLFRSRVAGAFAQELSRLEVVLDRTQDLARKVRVYGTPKPGGVVSRFLGGERVPDAGLRAYLLSIAVPEASSRARLPVGAALPSWFERLVAEDEAVRALWRGEGKPEGTDRSRSGFDYSLARALLRKGYTDVAELATILALRPGGGAGEKGEAYVRRTIANALVR